MARGQHVASEHSEKEGRTKKKRIRGACGECAHQKYPVSAQVVARGAACCASQVLDRGAQAVAS
jgi:hypothetical protein